MLSGSFNQIRHIGLYIIPFNRLPNFFGNTTQFCGPFYQIYLETRIGHTQGSVHPGDTTTDNQNIFIHGEHMVPERVRQRHTGHRHANQLFSLVGCFIRSIKVNPGILIPYIGHFNKIFIEAGPAKGILKFGFVRSGRTPTDHHPVQALFRNQVLNARHGLPSATMPDHFRYLDIG